MGQSTAVKVLTNSTSYIGRDLLRCRTSLLYHTLPCIDVGGSKIAVREPPFVGLRLAAHTHVPEHWLACKQQQALGRAIHGLHRCSQCTLHAWPSQDALGRARH